METNEQKPTTEENNEVLTEVTSVAEQEHLSGKKLEIDASELVQNAYRTFHPIKRKFMEVYGAMGGRARARVVSALLDLPMDNLKVLFKDQLEKEAFRLGQQLLLTRQLILTDAIRKEKLRVDELKAIDAAKKLEEQNLNNTESKENTNEPG